MNSTTTCEQPSAEWIEKALRMGMTERFCCAEHGWVRIPKPKAPKVHRFEVTDGEDNFAYVRAVSAAAAIAEVANTTQIDAELLTARRA
jgi:hypothetical protein